ncbi:MAG: tetratricopeptide repeat protein [Acidobacteriota bacterium]
MRASRPRFTTGGWYHLNSGRARQALEDLEAALALHSRDAWALNNRGLALLKLGRHQEAEQDFRMALAIEPGLAAAKKNLSIAASALRHGAAAAGGAGAPPKTGASRPEPGEPAGPRP